MRQHISENKSMVTVVAHNTLESLDPKRIDAAVWEVCCDGKKRQVNEILDAVVCRGFQRHIVDRRLDSLFSKKWFDHLGAANNRYYRLKPEIKHPNPEHCVQVETKPASKAVPDVSLAQYVSEGGTDLRNDQPIETQVSVLAQPIKVIQDLVVSVEDTPMVAIYKVLADGQAYSRRDIEIFLTHILGGAIYRTLNTMIDEKLVVRTIDPASVRVRHLFQIADTPEAKQFAATYIEKAVELDPLEVAAAKIPLLEVIISIKGAGYTMADARELAKELVDNGFGEFDDDHVDGRNLKYLKFGLEIAGVPFTLQEANTLAKQLIAEGVYVPE